MTHRREQAMAQIKVLLTGLTTTGDRIFRGRTLPLDRDKELPCWLLYMGADIPEDQHTPNDLIINLNVHLDAMVAAAEDVETILNQMDLEATQKLLDKDGAPPDYQIGLTDFVQQIRWLGSDEPEPEYTGDRAMMRQRSLWQVTYERSRTDPSS